MYTMPKKYLYVLIVTVIVFIGGLGLYIYSASNDAKIGESQAEVAALPDRTLTPTNTGPSEMTPETLEDSFGETTRDTPTPKTESNPSRSEPVTLNTFAFTGVADYTASGSAAVTQTNQDVTLEFGEDFSFGGAPDPVVYMCRDVNPSDTTGCLTIAALESNSGAQAWSLTASEAEQYPFPIIWCRAFDVLMARTI